MEFRILGPVEVVGDGGTVSLGGAKQRAVLALLVLNANHVVSRERLIDDLWGDDPPETAVTSIQVYVSRLRKLLPDGMLVTRSPGYMLVAEEDAIDVLRFERLHAEGRNALAAGDAARASYSLREALGLWRGPALAELKTEPFAQAEGARLGEFRLAALEARVDADLRLGRHGELVAELEQLAAEHPHREELRAQQMLALYRSGRQTDALEAYREARDALDELGIEPSERLRSLERAMLVHDPALMPAPPLVGGAIELPGPLRAVSAFPFVGRARELDALRGAVARAERGEGGQVVLVGAEAGGGKTRLAREVAHEAAERGTLVLYGASSHDVNMPYQPFVEALEFLVRVADPVGLDACLGEGRAELARLLPALGKAPALPAEDVHTARHRLHNAVGELLARVSAERPLLVVVDDIHWADAASVELLRELARAAPEARLCLVATYRDRSEDVRPDLAGSLAALARVEGITRITLGGLTRDDIGEFIARSAGADASGELAEALGTLTDGTPFLLCELWRALTDAESVEIVGSEVHVTRPLAELDSPGSVRDVVRYRVSRLPRETIAMLELAAVAGAEFQLSVIGDDATISAADEAVESGMIEPVSDPGASLRFTHELVRRAVYDELPSLRRADLHLHVGEALEREHSANLDRYVAELAHHFTMAAPVAGAERAIQYNVRAAAVAAGALAYDAAAKNLETALDLGIDDPSRRAALGFELGAALLQSGRLVESEVVLTRSMDAATEAEHAGLHAHAALLRNHVRLRTDAPTARAETKAVAEGAVDTFTRLGDSGGLAQAWRLLSHVHIRDCHWTEAAYALETALAHARRSGDKRELARVVTWLVAPLYFGPMPVPAVITRYEELHDEYGSDRYVDACITCHLAGVFAMTMRFDEARAAGERGISIFDEFGLKIAAAQMRLIVSDGLLVAGNFEAAEHELRTAYDIVAGAGDASGSVVFDLAAVLCSQGRYDEAETWASKGRESLGQSDVMTRIAGLTVEAGLASWRGSFDDALDAAENAVALAAQTDALNIRAHALTAQSDVLRAVGAENEADAARDEAIGLYRAKGNTAALAQAVATLDSTTLRSAGRVVAGDT